VKQRIAGHVLPEGNVLEKFHRVCFIRRPRAPAFRPRERLEEIKKSGFPA